MVREARFLWSDPFDDPQRRFNVPAEELDDLDLAPLRKRRRSRRLKTADPDESVTETPADRAAWLSSPTPPL